MPLKVPYEVLSIIICRKDGKRYFRLYDDTCFEFWSSTCRFWHRIIAFVSAPKSDWPPIFPTFETRKSDKKLFVASDSSLQSTLDWKILFFHFGMKRWANWISNSVETDRKIRGKQLLSKPFFRFLFCEKITHLSYWEIAQITLFFRKNVIRHTLSAFFTTVNCLTSSKVAQPTGFWLFCWNVREGLLLFLLYVEYFSFVPDGKERVFYQSLTEVLKQQANSIAPLLAKIFCERYVQNVKELL